MTESETNEKYPYTLGELIGWGGTFTYQGQLYELKNVDPLGSISISYVYLDKIYPVHNSSILLTSLSAYQYHSFRTMFPPVSRAFINALGIISKHDPKPDWKLHSLGIQAIKGDLPSVVAVPVNESEDVITIQLSEYERAYVPNKQMASQYIFKQGDKVVEPCIDLKEYTRARTGWTAGNMELPDAELNRLGETGEIAFWANPTASYHTMSTFLATGPIIGTLKLNYDVEGLGFECRTTSGKRFVTYDWHQNPSDLETLLQKYQMSPKEVLDGDWRGRFCYRVNLKDALTMLNKAQPIGAYSESAWERIRHNLLVNTYVPDKVYVSKSQDHFTIKEPGTRWYTGIKLAFGLQKFADNLFGILVCSGVIMAIVYLFGLASLGYHYFTDTPKVGLDGIWQTIGFYIVAFALTGLIGSISKHFRRKYREL